MSPLWGQENSRPAIVGEIRTSVGNSQPKSRVLLNRTIESSKVIHDQGRTITIYKVVAPIPSVEKAPENIPVERLASEPLFPVKDWTFGATGTAPSGCAPFTHLVPETTAGIGVDAQGNTTPPGGFYNHFITLYDGDYYDPSYGSGPFNNQMDWENASLDGYRKICVVSSGASPVIAVKEEDAAVVETVFIPRP